MNSISFVSSTILQNSARQIESGASFVHLVYNLLSARQALHSVLHVRESDLDHTEPPCIGRGRCMHRSLECRQSMTVLEHR